MIFFLFVAVVIASFSARTAKPARLLVVLVLGGLWYALAWGGDHLLQWQMLVYLVPLVLLTARLGRR